MACFTCVIDSGRYKSAPRSSFAQVNEASKSTLRSPGRMDDTTDRSNLDVERPGWWNVPESGRFHVWFWILRALCLISLTSVNQLWDSMADEVKWETYRKKAVNRRHYVNIAAGLVLTTSAGFLSTQPPLKSFVPYTTLVCYVLSLASFAHALGGLLCGLAVVNIYDACDRIWARDVLMATRFRLCCTLLFLSWANISLSISIVFLMTSLLIACYTSGVWWLQFLATIEILSWVWLPPLFLWCASEKTLRVDLGVSIRRIVRRFSPNIRGRSNSMV
ncbi:hypothetical protein K503DRAFT_771498 [Rhizopogon vinicolor AM-OR11-026]|uniref:Uncharacterized protein n=1 Tax=Rhizopogon vinicolor AM-OR11-026 TaxID=1314800 RepID=A0A1B7MXV3_9AGAM|nr:hypothetical protein K503DRAFT_771498 [Rhizopogon vinicolor AM-OR11-026]